MEVPGVSEPEDGLSGEGGVELQAVRVIRLKAPKIQAVRCRREPNLEDRRQFRGE